MVTRVVKIYYHDKWRKIKVCENNISLDIFKNKVIRMFRLSKDDLVEFEYFDDEGFTVTVGDDMELKTVVEDNEYPKFFVRLNGEDDDAYGGPYNFDPFGYYEAVETLDEVEEEEEEEECNEEGDEEGDDNDNDDDRRSNEEEEEGDEQEDDGNENDDDSEDEITLTNLTPPNRSEFI